MSKFTLNLTEQQEALLEELQEPLGVTTRADVIRKAIAFALLYKEIREKGQSLVITDSSGTQLERIRIL